MKQPEKQNVINFNATAYEGDCLAFPQIINHINKLCENIEAMAPGCTIDLQKLFIGDNVSYEYLNELSFISKLAANPAIAALNLPREKLNVLIEFTPVTVHNFEPSFILNVRAWLPCTNLYHFIGNRISAIDGWQDLLKEDYYLYAKNDTEIKRLNLLNQALKIQSELFELCPNAGLFNWEYSGLQIIDQHLCVDPYFVVNGFKFSKPVLFSK